ncbi:histidine kinase,GAF domain-containing protein, partial [Pseudomonas sp. GM84]
MDQRSFRKLLSRNIGLPLGVGLFGAVAFVAVINYLLSAMQWVEHTDRVIGNANETVKLSIDMETGMRGFLITGDERFLDPYEVAKPKIFSSLQSLRGMVEDNPQQVDRIDRLVALQQAWNDFGKEMITQRRNGGEYRQAVGNGRGKRITDEIRKEFDDLVGTEQQLRMARNEKVSSVTVTAISAFVLLIVGLSALLAYLGRRDLLALSSSYDDNLKAQQRSAERLEHQAWLRNGQTQLAEQVLGQLTLPMLGDNILRFFASYLGSVVGALYVRDGHGRLVRVASYGLDAEQQAREQVLASHEGLLAQVVREGRLLRLEDLPEDYYRLSSGLGSGLPRSAMLMPASDDGQINGVIELGFLRPLQERDDELMMRVADNLGISIESARYRQRLQEVLAETQQLNEELQVQQEELKTANEELEEQSRVLKESQAHLETQQAELEQTNEQLSERTDALDRKNDELSQAQEELQARADDLQRSSKYKSEFLANMSHELRTPLNSSLILAKLLAENGEGNLSGEQVKFAESIYSAGNDLLNLINDILDIAKVEAGKLEVRPETTHLERLVEGLRGMFLPLAEHKGLSFEVKIEGQVPATLFTDRQRLEQILKNLLSNAVKFTDHGQVSLAISYQAGTGIVFAVRDSGIGIAADQQQAIFGAFHQVDGSSNRRYGG